jgi:hypothetical protein
LIWIGLADAGCRVVHVVHRLAIADQSVADQWILEQALFAHTLARPAWIPGRQELQLVASSGRHPAARLA